MLLPIIRFSFISTIIIFGVLPFTGLIEPHPSPQSSMFLYVLSAIALLLLIVAPAINRVAAKATRNADGTAEPPTPEKIMGGRLVMYATWEGAAILGFVCYVLTGNIFVCTFFAGAAAAAIVAYKPDF